MNREKRKRVSIRQLRLCLVRNEKRKKWIWKVSSAILVDFCCLCVCVYSLKIASRMCIRQDMTKWWKKTLNCSFFIRQIKVLRAFSKLRLKVTHTSNVVPAKQLHATGYRITYRFTPMWFQCNTVALLSLIILKKYVRRAFFVYGNCLSAHRQVPWLKVIP